MLGVLALSTVILALGLVIWTGLVKREFLDPRIYVLYGLFHWVMVGQIGTILGYRFYEPVPDFDQVMHVRAAILVFLAVVSFIAGYYGNRLLVPAKRTISYEATVDSLKLTSLSCGVGILGISSLLFFQTHPQMIRDLRYAPLALTYMGVAASVSSGYILIYDETRIQGAAGLVVRTTLAALLFAQILLSNVAVIFPLFSVIYWSLLRASRMRGHVRARILLGYGLLCAFVVVFSLVSKRALQPYIATGEWNAGVVEEISHRVRTLDIFNPEGYGMILHAMEMYADSGDLLLGRSLLVLLPFLRFLSEDVRGFGRIMVLDVYGGNVPSSVVRGSGGFGRIVALDVSRSDYSRVNVSWAVPPIGELVANFGYLSVPIFYCLLGAVTKFLYSRCSRNGDIGFMAVYSVILPWLFLQQRGDFLNGNLYPAYVAALVGIIFWLCRRAPR